MRTHSRCSFGHVDCARRCATAGADVVGVGSGAAPPRHPAPIAPAPVTMHPHDLDASYIRMPLPPGQEKVRQARRRAHQEIRQRDHRRSRSKSRDDGELLVGPRCRHQVRRHGRRRSSRRQVQGSSACRMCGGSTSTLPPQWFPTAWEFSATGSGKTLTFKTIAGGDAARPATPAARPRSRSGLGRARHGSRLRRPRREGQARRASQSMPMPSVVGHSARLQRRHAAGGREGRRGGPDQRRDSGQPERAVGVASGVTTFSFGTEDTAAFQQLPS